MTNMDLDEESGNATSSLNTWVILEENSTMAEELNMTERQIPHWAGFWTDSESHGGEDVPVYATGKQKFDQYIEPTKIVASKMSS